MNTGASRRARGVGLGLLAALLALAACSSTDPASTTAAPPPSTAPTTTSSTTTVPPSTTSTTAAHDLTAIVLASLEATLGAESSLYTQTTSQRFKAGRMSTVTYGEYDLAAGVLTMSFDFGGILGDALASELAFGGSDPASLRVIVDAEAIYTGGTVDGEPSWSRFERADLERLVGVLGGLDVPQTVAIPKWSLLFDAIRTNPDLIETVTPLDYEITLQGRPLHGYEFVVEASAIAPMLVANRQVAILGSLEVDYGSPVPIKWWIDEEGYFVAASLDGAETHNALAPALFDALGQAEALQLLGEVESMTVELGLSDIGMPIEVEYPDPADVETISVDDEELDSIALRPGDCVDSLAVALDPLASPDRDCELPHRVEVFGTATLEIEGSYPGQDATWEFSSFLCDQLLLAYAPEKVDEMMVIYPTPATWVSGDRAVTCILASDDERVGSAKTAAENEVSPYALQPGMCFGEEAEFLGETVELVDCAEVHTFEVVGNTTLDWNGAFPGDDAIGVLGDEYCFEALDEIGAPLSYLAFVVRPTSQTWAYGDRTVTCLAEGFEPTTGSLFD